MAYQGVGNMTEFVKAWNAVLDAMKNARVIQRETIGTPASLTVRTKSIKVSFR